MVSLLQDPSGAPLERWTMCSKEEEPLVLQQFLRFGETRPITQQLLLQELTDRQNEEQRTRAQHEIRKLIERNAVALQHQQQQVAAAAAAAAAASRYEFSAFTNSNCSRLATYASVFSNITELSK